MAAPASSAPQMAILPLTQAYSSGFKFLELRTSHGNFCPAHVVTSRKEDIQAPIKPRESLPTPAPIPRGLPLCFIDEQELRQSNTKLRKVIRSHARRDTDLKRKQLNAALKSNLEIPRPIAGKISLAGQNHERPKLLTARVGSFHSSRLLLGENVVSFSETALGTLGSRSAPATPSGEDIAITRYNELNERFRSGRPSQRQPTIRSHEANEGNSNTALVYQFPKELHDQSMISFDCPTCRKIAASDRDMYDTQLLRPTASDTVVLDVGNSLLGSSWRQDPFDIHSDLHNPRVSFLLSYYNEIVNTVWVCNKSLWSFQTSCPALLHATMLYTASHLRFLSGSCDFDKDIFHHKGETMRIINASLDDPTERTSDQIIGALSSLILFEETYGSNQIAAVHRCGLKQLLYLRYSTSGVEMHRLVQHLLVHPQVDPDDPEISVDSTAATDHAGRLTNLSQSLTKNLVQGTILGHGVTSVYVWLTNTAQRAGNPLHTQEEYPILRNNIEIYLAAFPSPDFSIPASSNREWLIASMIYLHTILVTPAEASPLPASEEELVIELKLTMEKLLSNPNGFSYPCSMRLWVMMIGGLYSRHDDLELMGGIGIDGEKARMCVGDWSDAKILLRDVKWVERDEKEHLRGKSCAKEDQDAWKHLQGFYGDEVYKWKV